MSASFDPATALAYPWPLAPGWVVNFDLILKIVIANDRERRCFICGAEVKVGEEARVRWESPASGKGKSRFHYGCAECCAAMAEGEAAVAARRMRRSA